MNPEIESVVKLLRTARTELAQMKGYVHEEDVFDAVDDADLALGWALRRLMQIKADPENSGLEKSSTR
jgi:hypothetical protein